MHSAMFGKDQTMYHYKHLIPILKNSDGGAMIWAGFAATGAGKLPDPDTSQVPCCTTQLL